MTDFMRSHSPIVETYIQEEGSQYRFQRGTILNGDDYFLGRLNLSGPSLSIAPLADEETWYQGGEKFFVQDPLPFSQLAFAQALFPDFGHFNRQNYSFAFVRWEDLGDVHCAAIDVRPRGNSKKRGFVGRIWVEDQDFNIVRFRGTFTSKGLAKRAFHFDSWRQNTQADWWIPVYVYTEESKAQDLSSHKAWFKAQTRVWGYDRQDVGNFREGGKPADVPEDFPDTSSAEASYPREDTVAERTQAAGLMAPDGQVDQILETVVNNILVTNNVAGTAAVHCRVLLTTPLESFVVGRTIVLSRGLLDVLPDEATLAAVLSHELAHIILGHEVSSEYSTGMAMSTSDPDSFGSLNFHFSRAQEADADKKGMELFSNSPYKDQLVSAGLFVKALETSSQRFPVLLHGRFSNDFGASHLNWLQARAEPLKVSKAGRLDQNSALPIGSRIVIDPWSDRVEMLRSAPVRVRTKAEKMPFEVTAFYPHLKRLEAQEKAQARALE